MSWSSRIAPRALTPDHPVVRGTAQNPDVFFQAPRGGQPVLRRVPDDRPERDGSFAALTGRAVPAVRVLRRARRRARHRDDGLGRRDRAGDRRLSERARARRWASSQVRLFRPFSRAHLVAACPPTVQAHRRARSHQGAGRAGEPLYQDVRHSARRGGSRRPPCRDTAHRRRPLRPRRPKNSRRRCVPAAQPLPGGGGVGTAAAADAGGADRQADSSLRD